MKSKYLSLSQAKAPGIHLQTEMLGFIFLFLFLFVVVVAFSMKEASADLPLVIGEHAPVRQGGKAKCKL